MPYQYTCERCGNEFSHRQIPDPRWPKRYCSMACRFAPEPPIYQGDGTVLIPLSQGEYAVIDAEDAPEIAPYRWHITAAGYAGRTRPRRRNGQSKYIFMHHVVSGVPDEGLVTDHIDRDRLNNRRNNLRHISQSLNCHNNSMKSNNRSGFRGVHRLDPPKKWKASIKIDGKTKSLGLHYTAEEAARAYDKAAIEFLGDYANLNFPEEHGR